MVQRDPNTFKLIALPRERLLLFRPKAPKGNPEGSPIIRGAYVPYYYKTHLTRDEAIGANRQLVGIPHFEVPSTVLNAATTEAKAALAKYEDMGTQLRLNRQACVITPSDADEHGNAYYKFKLTQSPGTMQYDTDKMIARHNREMAIATLTDVLLTGHEQTGNFSLGGTAGTKTTTLALAICAYMDGMQDVINRHAVPSLFALNPGVQTVKGLPAIVHGTVEAPALRALAEWLKMLTMGGVDLTDDATQDHLRKLGGLPQLTPEE